MAPRETRTQAGHPQQLSPAAAARLQEALCREQPLNYTPQAVKDRSEDVCGQKWIPKARQLHEEFVTHREAYFQWASNDERAKMVYIAEWCRAFREKEPSKYGSRLADTPLSKVPEPLDVFLREHARQSSERRGAYEQKALYLVQMMGRPEFLEEFDRLQPDDKDELFAELVVRLGESEVGRTYFAVQLETPGSLLMTTVFKNTRKANTAFWRVLAEAGGTIAVMKGKDTVVFVEKLITYKVDVVKADLLRGRYDVYPAGTLVPVKEPKTITVFSLENVQKFDHFKAHRTAVGQAFDVLNLALALHALKENQGAKELISSVGALAGLVDKLNKSTKILTANGLLKGAGKATKVSVLAIVSGVCEAVTGSIDAVDRYTRGDYNAAFVAGVGAAGGAASAIGAGLILWGAGTTSTGVAAPVGVVLLIAGAIVSVGALVASFFVNDDPIEEWLTNCAFGKGYYEHSAFARFHGNLGEQVKALHGILTTTRFEAVFKEGDHAITVYPGMLLSCSSVTVTVTFKRPLTFGCVYRDHPVGPGWNLKLNGERVTSFVVPVRDVHGAHWSLYDSMTLTIKADVYNDGKTMLYEREETLTPSILERVSSWF